MTTAPRKINIGDRVRLLGLPDWLIHDLPESEQNEMRSFIGRSTMVRGIDSYGYFWLEFSLGIVIDEKNDAACCSGHSFCVPQEFIKLESDSE